jgi:S-formylglutathione hydrolase FrmB
MELDHFRVEEARFSSPSLRGNPLGDPVDRVVPVVVPRNLDRGRRYPVVYLLAGFGSSGRSLVNWQGWTPSLPERIDRLRRDGKIGDLIAVFPDAFTRYGGSQYLNSAATGNYEDMIVRDLVPWIDSKYPTVAHRDGRAVLGKSSGGYGALHLGMHHPEVFSCVVCHSGDMYFEYCYLLDFPRLLKLLLKHGGLEGFLKAFEDAPKKTTDLVLAMNVVAMAAAYSPHPGRPGLVDLPFDGDTGEIIGEVWNRWLARDPVRMCEHHAAALRSLRFLYLDCGKFDQFHLQYGLRILSRKLSTLGVSHVKEEFEDDHTDTAYRYEVSLPRLWESLGSSGA